MGETTDKWEYAQNCSKDELGLLFSSEKLNYGPFWKEHVFSIVYKLFLLALKLTSLMFSLCMCLPDDCKSLLSCRVGQYGIVEVLDRLIQIYICVCVRGVELVWRVFLFCSVFICLFEESAPFLEADVGELGTPHTPSGWITAWQDSAGAERWHRGAHWTFSRVTLDTPFDLFVPLSLHWKDWGAGTPTAGRRNCSPRS